MNYLILELFKLLEISMMIENWIKPKKGRKLIHQLFRMTKF